MSNVSESERDMLSRYLSETVKRLPEETWDAFMLRRKEAAAQWHTERTAPKPDVTQPRQEHPSGQPVAVLRRRGRRPKSKQIT